MFFFGCFVFYKMVTADSRVEYGSQKQKEEMKLAGSGVRSEIFLLYKNNYVYTKIYILTRHPWQSLFSPHTHFYIGSLIFFSSPFCIYKRQIHQRTRLIKRFMSFPSVKNIQKLL